MLYQLSYTPIRLVGTRGFEPLTPWSQTRCPTRLGDVPIKMAGVVGFEPTLSWVTTKRIANYPTPQKMVGKEGFEPPTPWSQARCATIYATFRKEGDCPPAFTLPVTARKKGPSFAHKHSLKTILP